MSFEGAIISAYDFGDSTLPPCSALSHVTMSPAVEQIEPAENGQVCTLVGARRMTIVGLIGPVAGCALLAIVPIAAGLTGYVAPLVLITAGYAMFQAANNTAVMRDVNADNRGVVSGMLNLSRNLGLITGASVMGAVFALASRAGDFATARPEAVATGMRVTFAVAAVLVVAALALAAGTRRGMLHRRALAPEAASQAANTEASRPRGSVSRGQCD